MKKLFFLFIAFLSNAVLAQDYPLFSTDGFQIKSNGQVFSDATWSNPEKNTYVSKDKQTKVLVKRTDGQLTEFLAATGISSAGDVASFANAYNYKLKSDGSVESLSYCVSSEFDCVTANEKNCADLVKINGFESGTALARQEKVCENLKSNKDQLRSNFILDGVARGKELSADLHKVVGGKYNYPYLNYFKVSSNPTDDLSKHVNGMCWAGFWSKEKSADSAKTIAKPATAKPAPTTSR